MKKCPRCQSSFDDDNLFCPNDGTFLVAEQPPTVAFNLPPTIQQHNAPFVVDLSPKPEIPTQFTPIPPINQPPQMLKKSSNNYFVPLIIGLVLGGVVVFALFFIIKGFDEKETAVAVNSNSSKNDNSTNSDDKSSKNSSTNSEKEDNSSNKSEKPANLSNVETVANTNTKKTNKYNGRVIMINAYIRSAPDSYADEIDVLPLNDRIIIGKRANPNSPWYRVTSESGISGWMHGNTIEFTQ